MKKILIAAALAGLSASSAFAADMAVKAPMYTKAVSPAYIWTGFYIGADAGGAWTHNSATWNPLPSPTAFGANAITSNDNGAGFIGGIHAGYNYQIAPTWVVGIEGDWMWSSEKGSWTQGWFNPNTGTVSAPGSFTTMSEKLNLLSSIRGRIGYLATPNLMAYGTGGVAFARFDDEASNSNGTAYATAASDHNTQTGFTVGGGLEYMMTAYWTVKAEYLFYRFNSGQSVTANSTAFPTFPSNYVWHSTNINVARAGVSYKF